MRVGEVAPDVFFVRSRDVNWVLMREGSDLTLIDGGYPGETGLVEASVREIGGRPEDVCAILLTHAHVDHLGAARHFHERYATPVYLDPVEVAHAHRDHLEQAGPADVLRNILRPGVLPWTLRIMRCGALRDVALPFAAPFPNDGALDLPGRPVPVATHGHTSGHTAFHLPASGAVITGDGLITGHAVSRTDGPQVLGPMFDHADARAALTCLEPLAADLVLPGHGPEYRGPIATAVAAARERTAD